MENILIPVPLLVRVFLKHGVRAVELLGQSSLRLCVLRATLGTRREAAVNTSSKSVSAPVFSL